MAECVNIDINMKLNKYLRIKYAARFDTDALPSNNAKQNFELLGQLADKANTPDLGTYTVGTYNTLGKPPGAMAAMGDAVQMPNTFTRGGKILFNDTMQSPFIEDLPTKIQDSPFYAFHEYGHAIDRDKMGLGSKALAFLAPQAHYRLNHKKYEVGADDAARALLGNIDDPTAREELVNLYNKQSAGNQQITDAMRPVDLAAGVGSSIGAVGGTLGGGYLGYKGGDKLYRWFNKNTKNKGYKPTTMHKLTKIVGAVGGGYLGNRIGGNVGDVVGSMVGARKLNPNAMDSAVNTVITNFDDVTTDSDRFRQLLNANLK